MKHKASTALIIQAWWKHHHTLPHKIVSVTALNTKRFVFTAVPRQDSHSPFTECGKKLHMRGDSVNTSLLASPVRIEYFHLLYTKEHVFPFIRYSIFYLQYLIHIHVSV